MRLSQFFMPVSKEVPAEATITSHRLMLRAGLVRQTAAGIYAWLPLGLRVLKNIEQIVREEMNRAGAVEVLMPTLQSADLWRQSGRYDDYGKEMLRITDRHDRDLLFGPTNEEMITDIFKAYARSYRDVPKNLYHIQWKFRDEVRPRFGVMRGREFLMKDAYSFDVDEAGARRAYNRMFIAYLNAFARMGLCAVPMAADTGPIGGDLSHEFIILAETGESQVFCHADLVNLPAPGADVDFSGDLQALVDARTALYAATEEKHDAAAFAALPGDKQLSARGIEVGHIFYFGDKYSKPMGLMLVGADGVERPAQMGSYGIGVSRLVGAVIEACHDEAGIIWPMALAPFHVGLMAMKGDDPAVAAATQTLYDGLTAAGLEVLWDDSDERPGGKFATCDLIGLPWRLVVGPKGLERGVVELKERASGTITELSVDAAIAQLAALRP